MIGIDEVGRGCLAGPLLVVAARQTDALPPGVADSKLIPRAKREEIFKLLTQSCEFGEGWVSAAEIDQRGLSAAMRLGVARALRTLNPDTTELIIMDGPINYIPKKFVNIKCIIGADAIVPIVSSASIYAKVRRDILMSSLKKKYPDYGFDRHVGYGTSYHLEALKLHGAIKDLHRMSFKPLSISIGASI